MSVLQRNGRNPDGHDTTQAPAAPPTGFEAAPPPMQHPLSKHHLPR
jgi:hypothetical protein